MSTLALIQRGIRPRLLPVATIVVSLLALTCLGLWMSRSLDAALYESLPEAMLAVAGIPVGAGIEVMAYSQMIAFVGALAAAGHAVAVGSDLIAGEEQDRTLPMLLAHPVSRIQVVGARLVTLIATVTLTALGLWLGSRAAAWLFGVELGQAHLGALAVALGANALFSGAVSFGVGAATGNHGLAAGIGGAVVLLGWLLAGLLPMSSHTEHLADLIPWSWYSRPQVIVGGLDGGRLALLLGGAALLVVLGGTRFLTRDLRGTAPAPWRDRLPRWLRPSHSRGPSLTGFLLSRRRTLFGITALVMVALMGVLMGVMFEQMAPQLESMVETMPPQVLQVFGATDMATPAGFYWAETLSLSAPAAVITLGVAVAHGLAADERGRRLVMLLPATSRMRLLGATLSTQVVLVTALAVLTGLGIWAGARLGHLDLPVTHIASATLHLAALGAFVSATAFLAAAASGRPAVTIWTAVVVGVGGHAIEVVRAMGPGDPVWARLSPFHWYGSSRPLHDGVAWGHVAVLLVGAALLWAVSFPLFQGRDLRK
ncbi:MAG: ABC transporter permease subunit [Arachnia propionica]|uniref:ABC transporter permease subunit n=1 Tax=Arachnia propionica TaxID=1750 RepID=UPI0026F930D4|nr:ABC transporter permease subunit [Arachnia propionica]